MGDTSCGSEPSSVRTGTLAGDKCGCIHSAAGRVVDSSGCFMFTLLLMTLLLLVVATLAGVL